MIIITGKWVVFIAVIQFFKLTINQTIDQIQKYIKNL